MILIKYYIIHLIFLFIFHFRNIIIIIIIIIIMGFKEYYMWG